MDNPTYPETSHHSCSRDGEGPKQHSDEYQLHTLTHTVCHRAPPFFISFAKPSFHKSTYTACMSWPQRLLSVTTLRGPKAGSCNIARSTSDRVMHARHKVELCMVSQIFSPAVRHTMAHADLNHTRIDGHNLKSIIIRVPLVLSCLLPLVSSPTTCVVFCIIPPSPCVLKLPCLNKHNCWLAIMYPSFSLRNQRICASSCPIGADRCAVFTSTDCFYVLVLICLPPLHLCLLPSKHCTHRIKNTFGINDLDICDQSQLVVWDHVMLTSVTR